MTSPWHPWLPLEDLHELRHAIRLLVADPDEEHTGADGPHALTTDEIKVLGRDLVETIDTPNLETVTSGSDWLLFTALEAKEDDDERRESLLLRALSSASRSPLIGYDGYYEGQGSRLADRGRFREAIEWQRRALAEGVRRRRWYDVQYNLVVLAELNAEAGFAPAAVELLTYALRTCPEEGALWWLVGRTLRDLRLPAIARIVIERAAELGYHDPSLVAVGPDAADCPAALLDALRAAARTTSRDAEPVPLVARRIAADLATTPVKELPPVPDREELEKLRARLEPLAADLCRQLLDEHEAIRKEHEALRAHLRAS